MHSIHTSRMENLEENHDVFNRKDRQGSSLSALQTLPKDIE